MSHSTRPAAKSSVGLQTVQVAAFAKIRSMTDTELMQHEVAAVDAAWQRYADLGPKDGLIETLRALPPRIFRDRALETVNCLAQAAPGVDAFRKAAMAYLDGDVAEAASMLRIEDLKRYKITPTQSH